MLFRLRARSPHGGEEVGPSGSTVRSTKKTIAEGVGKMYQHSLDQLSVYDVVSPLGDAVRPDNRWVRLAARIDWRALEEQYAAHFKRGGKQAIPLRCAFGSLVIKRALGVSDRQTVELIRESPYLQYFIGLPVFTETPPFSARSMAAFRARIPEREVARAARLLHKK